MPISGYLACLSYTNNKGSSKMEIWVEEREKLYLFSKNPTTNTLVSIQGIMEVRYSKCTIFNIITLVKSILSPPPKILKIFNLFSSENQNTEKCSSQRRLNTLENLFPKTVSMNMLHIKFKSTGASVLLFEKNKVIFFMYLLLLLLLCVCKMITFWN